MSLPVNIRCGNKIATCLLKLKPFGFKLFSPTDETAVCSQDFVKFIVKGLEGNILQPFDEGNFRKAELAAQNQVQLASGFISNRSSTGTVRV